MADNYQVLDGTGALITISAKDIGAGIKSANIGLRDYLPGQAAMAASLPVAIASDQPQVNTPLEATGTIAALNDAVTLDLKNMTAAGVQLINTGSFVGTITFEASLDNTNWKTTVYIPSDLAGLTGNPNITQTNANMPFSGSPMYTGFRYIRARCSAYTSGSCTASFCAKPSVFTVALPSFTAIQDNAAFTDGFTRLVMSGFIFDETAGTALTENDAGAARMDSKRALVCGIEDATTRGQRVAVDAAGNLQVAVNPVATGGSSIGKILSAASTNATNLKASAGQINNIALVNTNAAVRYLKLYNKASAPTVGTDTPVATIAIPGNAAGNGIVIPADLGAAFATGISYALTTGAADADTGAVAANEITGWILYK